MRYAASFVLLLAASAAPAEPLVFDNGRLFVKAQVNGVATEALLDSGAEVTLIDDDLAKAAGLPPGQAITIRGSGGEQQATVVPGVRLQALGAQMAPEAVVVMDLADLGRRLIRRPTSVVLGREIFDAARLTIDIEGGTIGTLSRDEKPAGSSLPLTAHAGIESIPVTVGGIVASAEFDLGNGSGVLISRAFADRLGLKPHGKRAGGGIGGELMRDLVTIPRMELAGAAFEGVEAAIDDQPNANDLNVGTSILKEFVITTDFAQRRIWLARRAGERG